MQPRLFGLDADGPIRPKTPKGKTNIPLAEKTFKNLVFGCELKDAAEIQTK